MTRLKSFLAGLDEIERPMMSVRFLKVPFMFWLLSAMLLVLVAAIWIGLIITT